jgi:hypothetical protein
LNTRRPTDEERQRESRETLARTSAESGVIGSSALAQAARHFMAADAPQEDRIEVWGRRIARVLALLFVGYLVLELLDFMNR